MSCCVLSCVNDGNSGKPPVDLTFHKVPQEYYLKQLWTEAGIPEWQLRPGSEICSAHFPEIDFTFLETGEKILVEDAVPTLLLNTPKDLDAADLNTCRACLATDRKMYHIKEHNLSYAYETIVGLMAEAAVRLPQMLCWECAARLISLKTFKEKAQKAQLLLLNKLTATQVPTVRDVKSINRIRFDLKSRLTITYNEPFGTNNDEIGDEGEETKPPGLSENLAEHLEDSQETNEDSNAEDSNVGDKDSSLKDGDSDIQNIYRDVTDIEFIDTNVLDDVIEVEDGGNHMEDKDSNANDGDSSMHNILYTDIVIENDSNVSDDVIEVEDAGNHMKDKDSNANDGDSSMHNILYTKIVIENDSNVVDDVIEVEDEDNHVEDKNSDVMDIDCNINDNNSNLAEEDRDIMVEESYLEEMINHRLIDHDIDTILTRSLSPARDHHSSESETAPVSKRLRRRPEKKKAEVSEEETKECRLNSCCGSSEDSTPYVINQEASRRVTSCAGRPQPSMFDVHLLSPAEQVALLHARQQSDAYRAARHHCGVCYRHFPTADKLAKHAENHREDSGPLVCEVCKFQFRQARELNLHHDENHRARYSCRACEYVTVSRASALTHARLRHPGPFECPHCAAKNSKSKRRRCSHPQLVSPFACGLCGYLYANAFGLDLHRAKDHEHDALTPLTGPTCARCDTRFASDDAYQRHLSMSRDMGRYYRSTCASAESEARGAGQSDGGARGGGRGGGRGRGAGRGGGRGE